MIKGMWSTISNTGVWAEFKIRKSILHGSFQLWYVTMTSHLMTPYKKINIASEKTTKTRIKIKYKILFQSNHCRQISILVQERPEVLAKIQCFLFVRQGRVHFNILFHWILRLHNKIFNLIKPVYIYACTLASLY